MKSFEFYDRFLMKAVEILTTVLMFVLVGLVFFQVLNRFILHIPAAWTEEMARYNFVWLSLFGSVIALKSGRHLSVDLVVQGIKSQKAQDWVKVMVALLVLVFSLIPVSYTHLDVYKRQIAIIPSLTVSRKASRSLRRAASW